MENSKSKVSGWSWFLTYPMDILRGYCTSYQKIACFVLYLEIIDNFLKITYASYSNLFKELKSGIEILVGQVVFNLDQNSQKCYLDQ